ncbi:MAG TPA: ABC transporter permease, partial [Gammaproteobacteria bacterium]|nr:ABC transporter permease [Gammaproteobacteria bacterium]
MSFKPVVLWTDALVYLLVAVVLVLVWHIRRNEYLLAPWRRVGHSASGMAALTVLVFFIVMGLLDTVHFRPATGSGNGNSAVQDTAYSVEVLSLLDIIAAPLRTRVEKTYSAPFAAHLYARETIDLPGGGQTREFPRLKYGGAHLQDPEIELMPDILAKAAAGAGGGLLLWCVLVSSLAVTLARRTNETFMSALASIQRGTTSTPWYAICTMLALILLLSGAALALCGSYHIFGTDKVGQDVFYLSLKSIRTGLVIGTLTTLMMLPFALALGITAGYFRGWVDDVIQYLYTTLSSIPSVLLIAAAVLMMQVYIETRPELFDTVAARADLRLLFLCVILGVTS